MVPQTSVQRGYRIKTQWHHQITRPCCCTSEYLFAYRIVENRLTVSLSKICPLELNDLQLNATAEIVSDSDWPQRKKAVRVRPERLKGRISYCLGSSQKTFSFWISKPYFDQKRMIKVIMWMEEMCQREVCVKGRSVWMKGMWEKGSILGRVNV